MRRRAAARGNSGGRFFFVYLAPRLVAAGPAFGGERGSLPRTVSILGTPPDGCRWLSWGLRRHLAVRAGPECARLLHDAAGAQPRPPPKAGPGAPRCGFGDLADLSTVMLTRATRLRGKHGECSWRRGPAGRALANPKLCPEMCLFH